jgi:hypothetical protein
MIQSVLIFLLLIVVLGLGGRILQWARMPPKRRPEERIERAARCPTCRSFVVGRSPSPCDRQDCPYRA